MKGRPEDWTRVVRSHAHDTLAYIVTGQDPSCITLAKDEVRHINRWMQFVRLDRLPKPRAASWFMAVLVCKGDDWTPLAAWMHRHGAQRIRFYLHPRALTQQLAPIRDAGHELRHVRPERYATYGALHKRLALDLSDQVYADFRPT